MARIVDDMNQGMKSWIEETKKIAPDDTIFSAILFDDHYSVVHERTDIQNVTPESISIVPRGSTALLDSMMKALSLVKDDETALIIVTTDGKENSSTETTLEELQARISSLTKNGVEFVYMSSDPSAFDDAVKYGATQTHAYASPQAMSIMSTAHRSNSTESYLKDSTNPSTATKKDRYPSVDTNISINFDSVRTKEQQEQINTVVMEGIEKFKQQMKNKKELLPT